jgi:hypothetical protein
MISVSLRKSRTSPAVGRSIALAGFKSGGDKSNEFVDSDDPGFSAIRSEFAISEGLKAERLGL